MFQFQRRILRVNDKNKWIKRFTFHNTNTAITCLVKIPKLDCSAEDLHDVMNSEPARPSKKVYCMRGSRTFCQTMITLFFRLFSWWGEGGSKYHCRRLAKRHLNDGPTLNAGLKAFWIWASIAKKPYIFVISQGGGGVGPHPPSGSAHVLSTGLQICVSHWVKLDGIIENKTLTPWQVSKSVGKSYEGSLNMYSVDRKKHNKTALYLLRFL